MTELFQHTMRSGTISLLDVTDARTAVPVQERRRHIVRTAPKSPDQWGPRRASGYRYHVCIDRRIADLSERLRGPLQSLTATAFQMPVWLAAWYATIGVAIGEPMLVTVFETCTGEIAAILPLIRRTVGPMTVVEFADGGVSDNNAPILGPAAPVDAAGANALWLTLCKALSNVDLLRLTRMPTVINGRVNPLALIRTGHASAVNRNVVTIDGTWEQYLKSLDRRFRKELGRSWRVFQNHDGTSFHRLRDKDETLRVLIQLERQQSDHMKERGAHYVLDQPEVVQFYRQLLSDGLSDGSVILTTLMRGTEVVSALLGIARNDTYVMIRISSGASEWSNCSPGRLVIVRTMQMLHADGFRHFDFSIGNYAYKRRLGVEPEPLQDLVRAQSLLGVPLQIWDRITYFVRQHAWLHAFARRMRGRSLPSEPISL